MSIDHLAPEDSAAPTATGGSGALADFVGRHVGPAGDDVRRMLEIVGQPSLDAMCDRAIPGAIRSESPLRVEAAASESAVIDELRTFAARNTVLTSLIGLGYYGTVTPPVVRRNVLENPAWYTAYTPYQPEISQGRLEALLNFQTVVTDLTGLDVAGSSLLDESTAAAEAMSLMRRASKTAAADAVVLVDERLFPQTIAVMRTRAEALGLPLVVTDLRGVSDAESLSAAAGGRAVVGAMVQYPDASGQLVDWTALAAAVHEAGALVTACADLLALTLVTAPGEWGADIAVGTAQRFGVPMGFGGPHAGYMSVHRGLERQLPGRLVGVSIDAQGQPAYRLALQTREQHIRREKATSNICTAQVLLAVMASMYAVWHGPAGLVAIARRVNGLTAALRDALVAGGLDVETTSFFDTLTVVVPGRAADLTTTFADRGINVWLVDADRVSLSLDETSTAATVTAVLGAFDVAAPDTLGAADASGIEAGLERSSDFLTHPVFHAHHSETAMLRYLRRLADRDFALDRGMIPLGSCTMKLNATTEMESVTWPEFANLHPFAPADQTEGIRALIDDLAGWLCEITGYDAVSLQPNAGSQGEFAGLLAIHAYHQARGEGHRRVCLIPASAHGTNAASAVMAGPQGRRRQDCRRAAPSTWTTCAPRSRHTATTSPRSWSPIPRRTASTRTPSPSSASSSTRPAARSTSTVPTSTRSSAWPSRASSAPTSATSTCTRPSASRTVAAAPASDRSPCAPTWHRTCRTTRSPGRPGPRPASAPSRVRRTAPRASCRSRGRTCASWAATACATRRRWRSSGANYIAARLREHYPVLYSGHDDLVAHECILDVRQITAETGVTVDDIAKRLVDYGFHAPTMSFPVAGTLMVEPTESENLYELDRFCDAMIAIRGEIEAIRAGEVAVADSMLRHAPHTARGIAGEWDHPYDRSEAAFPVGVHAPDKYWPPVSRIDGAYGDRHLVCSCPPPEAFEN